MGLYFLALLTAVFAIIVRGFQVGLRRDKLESWGKSRGLIHLGGEVMGRMQGVGISARLNTVHLPKQTQSTLFGPDTFITLYARFEPPLDMGLSVQTSSNLPFEGAGQFITRVGEIGFDRYVSVHADEPHRARALLSPQMREALRLLRPRDGHLLMTDQGIAVQRNARYCSEHWLDHTATALVRAVSIVYAHREHLPCSSALSKHLEAWRPFAHENGLLSVTAPLGMWGRVRDAEVYTYAVRTAHMTYEQELWLKFPIPLDVGLLVQPMSNTERIKDFFASGDIKLGDEAFDDLFLVRGTNEQAVRDFMNEAVRKLIWDVHHAVGPPSLTDEGLSVRLSSLPTNPHHLFAAIDQLIALAETLQQRRGVQNSPYR